MFTLARENGPTPERRGNAAPRTDAAKKLMGYLIMGFFFLSGAPLTAQAAHFGLLNGDAESNPGVPDDWNADDAVLSVEMNANTNIPGPSLDPDGGLNFFSTGELAIDANGSAGLDQDVNGTNGVWGCGVEGIQGMYTLTGLVATGTADNESLVAAAFTDPLGNPLPGSSVAPATTGDGTWAAFTPIGPNTVPENASTMNVGLTGTAINDAVVADVGFDNMVVVLTGCVDSFAKISGKVMGDGGNRGQWSFSGSVGVLHDDGELVVSDVFTINYKSIKQSCAFTPTDLSFDGTTAVVTADYDCNDGDGLYGIDAIIRLVAGTGGSNGGGNVKDRGAVCVDAPDEELNIGDSCTVDDGDELALKNGNVHTDDDTSNGAL